MWTILYVLLATHYSPTSQNSPAVAITQIGEYRDVETCKTLAAGMMKQFSNNGKQAVAYVQCVQIKDIKK